MLVSIFVSRSSAIVRKENIFLRIKRIFRDKKGWYVTISEFLDYQLKNIDQDNLQIGTLNEFYLDLISLIQDLNIVIFRKLMIIILKLKLG